MIAEVAPLLRLARTLPFFDYEVPERLALPLREGQLVRIPFRTKKVIGVLLRFKKTSAQKNVAQILGPSDPVVVLTPEQQKIAQTIAEQTGTSLGLVFRSFLPDIPKRATSAAVKPQGKETQEKLSIPRSSVEVFQKTLRTLSTAKTQQFFLSAPRGWRFGILLKLIERTTAKKQSIVIFFPEIEHLQMFSRILPESLHKKTISVHGQLSKTEFLNAWKRVEQERSTIVLATRIGLLFPFHNLHWVIMDDAESQHWKQEDQNPRYDTRIIAEHIAQLHDASFLLSGVAPTLVQWHRIQKKEILPLPSPPEKNIRAEIVSLHNEQTAKHFSLITPRVEAVIRAALAKKRSVVLFLNRLGYTTFTLCRDCSHVFTCPACAFPLTTHRADKKTIFLCHHCAKQYPMTLSCPGCSGTRFFEHGIGIEKIQEEVLELFGKHDSIVITTHPPENWHASTPLFASVVLSADTLFHLPLFDSAERTFLWLSHIHSFTQEHKGEMMIVQTFAPDHAAIQAVTQQRDDLFYTHEQSQRKTFSYPPFRRLILLFAKNNNKEELEQEAQQLYTTLNNRLHEYDPTIKLSEPFAPHREIVRGKYHRAMLVKVAPDDTTIFSFLHRHLPVSWMMNTDPQTL